MTLENWNGTYSRWLYSTNHTLITDSSIFCEVDKFPSPTSTWTVQKCGLSSTTFVRLCANPNGSFSYYLIPDEVLKFFKRCHLTCERTISQLASWDSESVFFFLEMRLMYSGRTHLQCLITCSRQEQRGKACEKESCAWRQGRHEGARWKSWGCSSKKDSINAARYSVNSRLINTRFVSYIYSQFTNPTHWSQVSCLVWQCVSWYF